jgi:hypothetical protein
MGRLRGNFFGELMPIHDVRYGVSMTEPVLELSLETLEHVLF